MTRKQRYALFGLVDLHSALRYPVTAALVRDWLSLHYRRRGFELTATRSTIRHQLDKLVEHGYVLRRKAGYVPRAAAARECGEWPG